VAWLLNGSLRPANCGSCTSKILVEWVCFVKIWWQRFSFLSFCVNIPCFSKCNWSMWIVPLKVMRLIMLEAKHVLKHLPKQWLQNPVQHWLRLSLGLFCFAVVPPVKKDTHSKLQLLIDLVFFHECHPWVLKISRLGLLSRIYYLAQPSTPLFSLYFKVSFVDKWLLIYR